MSKKKQPRSDPRHIESYQACTGVKNEHPRCCKLIKGISGVMEPRCPECFAAHLTQLRESKRKD